MLDKLDYLEELFNDIHKDGCNDVLFLEVIYTLEEMRDILTREDEEEEDIIEEFEKS